MKWSIIFPWILKGIAAVLMLQTLFYKFSGAEESKFIFSQLGMEPWGRIGTGVLELLSSILILIPTTTAIGAVLGIGLMSGAIFFHLTKLGISVQGDGGQLFFYAVAVMLNCIALVILYRRQIFTLFRMNPIF